MADIQNSDDIDQSDDTESNAKSDKESDKELLGVARNRWNIAVDAETEIRSVALDDMNFRAGDQWDVKVKQSRDCLFIHI